MTSIQQKDIPHPIFATYLTTVQEEMSNLSLITHEKSKDVSFSLFFPLNLSFVTTEHIFGIKDV